MYTLQYSQHHQPGYGSMTWDLKYSEHCDQSDASLEQFVISSAVQKCAVYVQQLSESEPGLLNFLSL